VHLLHRLYGVDALAYRLDRSIIINWTEMSGSSPTAIRARAAKSSVRVL